ncbi:MAG: HlyD family efflux transporter periplasmic adaptor subunit [Oscillospiraceae bacterium]|nr:HlyD family efflux transporter periplasmic adaptor subunit [Oscillospiraceae bacterium]
MPQTTPEQSGEEIFAQHRSARKRRKRRILITAIVLVVLILALIVVGITMLRRSVTSQFSSDSTDSVLSAEVTTGSISTTVSGSGTLTAEDEESVEMLSTLEIDDFYVEEGDAVEEGDLIATVTSASLSTAMSDLQSSLDALDEEIESASEDEVSDTVTASVSGRVKAVYVTEGDDVVTVMYNSGALMLLSLDGYMAVDVETDTLAAGDTVTVTASDGTEYTGTVEKVVSGVATVLVTDNGPTYGDTVTVGDSLTGTLYIHSELKITGYAGTVDEIEASENEAVDAGDTLLTLTDTETSANYDSLLEQRAELEEQLAELVQIYKEGGILAPSAGVIESLTETSSSSSSSSTGSTASADAMSGGSTDTTAATTTTTASYTEIATISPDVSMSVTISVDETDILSLEEGQTATVTIDSLSDDSYEGTVTEIDTSASSSSGVTSYTATITIDKVENMLAGMTASVVITIEGVDDALLIPVDALHQTSSTAYVYTEYDESTGEYSGMVEVTVGLSNSSYVEITSGLSEGDVVYYTDSSSTEDSMADMFSSMGGSSGGGFDSGSSDMGGMSGGSDAGGGMSMPSGGGPN